MASMSPGTECQRQRELMVELAGVLDRLHRLLNAEKEAVERRDRARMDELEAGIEQALAEKEEAFRALRGHVAEHNC